MKRIAAVIGALALAFPVAAGATTVTLSHVFDPAGVAAGLSNSITPFNLGVGDTLDLTVTFTGGQTLNTMSDSAIWLYALTDSSYPATLSTSGTYEFLGASPNIVSGPIAFTQDNLYSHVGAYLFSTLYRTDPAPISFSGLRQVITINSVAALDPADDPSLPRAYNSLTLFVDGRVATGPAVPEPSTWALMIGGFGLAGTALRRRRAAVVI